MVFSPGGSHPPEVVSAWLVSRGFAVVSVQHSDDLMARSLRGRPRVVVFDARENSAAAEAACARLKSDSFTGIVPALMVAAGGLGALASAFDAGADEVVTE